MREIFEETESELFIRVLKTPMPEENEHCIPIERIPNREEWALERGVYLGASQIPIVMGMTSQTWGSPFTLQHEKLGLVERDGMNDQMKMGILIEPFILKSLGIELDTEVESYQHILVSKRWPWMGCMPDGKVYSVTDGDGEVHEPALVQAKNSVGFMKWEQHVDGRIEPMRVWCQVQAEMAVTGDPWCYVVALVNGFDLKWARIKRDDTFIEEEMIPRCQLWVSMTNAGEMLPADWTESCRETLKKLWPTEKVGEVITLPLTALDDDDLYLSASEDKKRAEKKIEGVKNTIRHTMKDAARAELSNGAFWTWKSNKNGARVLKRSKGKAPA